MQGISDVPSVKAMGWESKGQWTSSLNALTFEATSKSIVEDCKKNPDGFVRFPVVPYGAHEIFIDGKKSLSFGDPSMKTPNYVVSSPILKCEVFEGASSLQWRATAYSRYYAHIHSYPSFVSRTPLTRLFGETFYIGSSIGLLVLAIFSISVLYGKESNRLMFSLCSAMVLNATYQLALILPAFEIEMPMRTAHRVGDASLGLGFACVMYCFWLERLIPSFAFRLHMALTALAVPFWLFGTTGDTIQFGTSLPMLSVLGGFVSASFRLLRVFRGTPSLESAFTCLFSIIFVLACANDILVFTGSREGLTFMSIGLLSAFLVLMLAINQRMTAAYAERDYLRGNLELEVGRKTAMLNKKSSELEEAMNNLRHTQAELVQSAKLASLGTLSAGIAHEINNSINFVNGAITPLDKIVAKLATVSPRDYEVAQKLLRAIKDGVTMTVNIVRSLRQFTGLNQAKLKEMNLKEVVHSVVTILSSKLRGEYQVKVEFDPDLTLFGDVVGINQILMNLMTNAIDAMPSGGTITVKAHRDAHETVIEVSDTGSGIPEGIRSRVFDPFFTTKDVGQGTGLGLFIIANEIKKHQGTISLNSTTGEGTTFRMRFPRHASDLEGEAA